MAAYRFRGADSGPPSFGSVPRPVAAQQEDGLFTEQVGEGEGGAEATRRAELVEEQTALDARIHLAAQRDEVADGAEVDVRAVVPGVRQGVAHRHSPLGQQSPAQPPVREVRHRDDGVAADAQQLLQRRPRRPHRLQRLAEHHVVERPVWIVEQVGVGVALDYRKPGADAGVDAVAGQLDAAPVDLLELHEVVEQRAVAAADVEHSRTRLDHVGDQLQVDADGGGRRRHSAADEIGRPRCCAAPARKPPSTRWKSGSSSRNASCPLLETISAKLTLAATAFSACTIRRLSTVGYSQSLVNEMTQKRTGVSRNAFAKTPPCRAAISK